MNHLVKFTNIPDRGDNDEVEFLEVWHLNWDFGTCTGALCTGELTDDGSNEFEEKFTKRGGITCPNCIAEIKRFRSIKL